MNTDDPHDPTGNKPANTDSPKAYAGLAPLLGNRMQSAIDKANALPIDEPLLTPLWSIDEIKANFNAARQREREAAKASFDLYAERFLKHRDA